MKIYRHNRLRVALAVVLVACGARSGLLLDEERAEVEDAGSADARRDSSSSLEGGAHDAQNASDARNAHDAQNASDASDARNAPDGLELDADTDGGPLCVCALGETTIAPGPACAATSDTTSLGCEFWPVTIGNPTLIHPLYDAVRFAISVSNPGPADAEFEVLGPCGKVTRQTLAPGASTPVILPWVEALKFLANPDAGDIGSIGGSDQGTQSVRQSCGAYRLLSTQPVAVTQYNPYDAELRPHSNDASRLRPTSSLGTRYRVAGYPVRAGEPPNGSYIAIAAVKDGTTVTIHLGPRGSIRAGAGVDPVGFGGTAALALNLGDVAELLVSADNPSEFNGTTIEASQPVEVFTGHPCALNPAPQVWCDHLEETLPPVDRLGAHYVVPVPSHPLPGHAPLGHSVIMVGAFDGTDLVYAPSAPAGAPLHLQAGDAIDLERVTFDFDVQATRPFVLLTMMLGSSQLDDVTFEGDPSFGLPHDTREFRPRYVFFAAPGYDTSFADVVAPVGTALVLDGAPVSVTPTPIGGSSFAVQRVAIGGGSHVVTSPAPIGLQVRGYANAQSYDYPATGAD